LPDRRATAIIRRRHAALDRDALDLVREQPLDQILHPDARLRQRCVRDDELAIDDADGDGGERLMERFQRGEETLDVAREQRMIGRIELRGARAGRKSPEQLFVNRNSVLGIGTHR
jgi:hypothetical protein